MTSSRPQSSLLLTALTSAFFITSCGGDGGNDGGVEPPPPPETLTLSVAAGGNNVQERFTSDLWVHQNHAYTGTWGGGTKTRAPGNVVKIWDLGTSGAPALTDSLVVPDIGTVSDVQVSADGELLVFSAERGNGEGLYVYDLADPKAPAFRDSVQVPNGIHTATVADIDGRRYVFAAHNPSDPSLLIYDITDPSSIALTATVPVPADYGIHDTYVRDGIAFVFAWNTGVIIYDVGNGTAGGSPAAPAELSRLVTSAAGVNGGPQVHNGWWFHNPATSEARYLFIGQEGPYVAGSFSSGDIHVVDVSDLRHPQEVASFHLDGAGTHNFWMDESRQILYAAYYNAGVVAIDVSGTLSGDLSGRLLDRLQLAGAGQTFTWGVQVSNGWIYASDMITGLWQIQVDPAE